MASYAYRFPKKAMQKNALTPQAKHHFTRFDQVSQLVGASEADPDIGYRGRQLTLCCLPRTNPGDKSQYLRENGICGDFIWLRLDYQARVRAFPQG